MLDVSDGDASSDPMDRWDSGLSIASLTMDYDAGVMPQQVVRAIYDRIEAYKEIQSSVWLHLQPLEEVVMTANTLFTRWPNKNDRPPLWGIPFSVKDSINIIGLQTTVGCPALAFTANASAPVYQRCIDAGALFIGKTNMEQLATGMTGCRSPYGQLHSTFSKDHIVGGSSSGSAITVSAGLVSFSLGSDTAGSIRVPAQFNGIVGFKPTKGTVSARGVFPACQHQDCVSFLCSNTEDTQTVWEVCRGYDKEDSFSKLPSFLYEKEALTASPRFRFGIPPAAALDDCNSEYRRCFTRVIETLTHSNGRLSALDWTPFTKANDLLYNSSFVLERLTILPDGWFDKNKQLLHPVIQQVFEDAVARNSTAIDLFKDLHRQAEYKRAVEDILTLEFDAKTDEHILTVLVVPTTPFHPTIEEIHKDPLRINTNLGIFAHFANVLDLVAIAVPCGIYAIDNEGPGSWKTAMPFGVTILAGCGFDKQLLTLARALEDSLGELGQDG